MTDTSLQPPVWRLRADHYLNTDPQAFFVQRVADEQTGEQVEHRYPVPRLLQLADPKAANDGAGGILVSTDKAAKLINARMWIFLGPPTADMEPQNEAAQAITDVHSAKWLKPFEELSATGGHSGNFAKDLEVALAAVLSAAQGKATSIGTQEPDVVAVMQKKMEEMAEQIAKLTGTAPADGKARRA